jgi:hypothetical protein
MGLVLGMAAAMAIRQVGSLDVGFHLSAGEWILSGHGWARTDPFTFTARDQPYVDTSWGFQVLAALAHRAAGPPGLVALQVLLVVATFAIVWRTARLQAVDPGVLAFLFLLSALSSEIRFEVRPELVSYLLLAVLLHVLHRRACRLRAPLWALPALMLVWVNAHALFVLGLAALGAFVVGLAVRERRLDTSLLRWSAAAAAITVVNPYGLRGVLFPLELLSRFREGNPFAESIGEFVSPLSLLLSAQMPFYPVSAVHSFRVLLALALVAGAVSLARRHVHAVLLLLAFVPLAVGMIRNMPLLAIGCLPVVAHGLPLASWLARRRWPPARGEAVLQAVSVTVGLAALVLAVRARSDAHYVQTRRIDRFGWGVNEIALPVAAARHATHVGLDGPVLNHLNFGGWLGWALGRPVFIDGRLEVMGEDLYEAYREALGSEAALEACVARHGIQWIVFPHSTNPRLLGRLSRDPRWRLAHVDPVATAFVREGPDAAGFVDERLPALLAPPAPVVLETLPGLGGVARRRSIDRFVSGLVRRETFPYAAQHLGLFHIYRGEHAHAAAQFARGIRESDGAYHELYVNLAAALDRMGRPDDARRCRAAAEDDQP